MLYTGITTVTYICIGDHKGLFYSMYVASTVTIGFETGNVTANEGDGSVTVNLVKTGDHSDNITVYINVMRVENSAIVKCMYMHIIIACI